MYQLKLRAHPILFSILFLLWMGVLFIASSIPGSNEPPLFYGDDKVKHLVAYAVFGFLFALVLASRTGRVGWSHVFLITVLALGYGVTDEYHQSFVPLRTVSIGDVIADTLGGFLAAVLARGWLLVRKPGVV